MNIIRLFSKRAAAALLCVLMIIFLSLPAFAAGSSAVLKVAFYPLDGFFEYDESGREAGYGVELLDKISQYTGIKFEYVKAESWESTKEMLLDGTADIRMPGTLPTTPSTTLSYSAQSILDTYDVILTLKDRDDLYYQDFDTIKTLKIAVSKGFADVNSVQDYLASIGVEESQLIYAESYNESREMLESGEADALISNIMDMDDSMKMLSRFNSYANYISMTLGNPSLSKIDEAISSIKLDEPLFLSNLYEEWFPDRITVPLTLEESEYLASLDSITFAFREKEGYLSRLEDGEYYGIYTEMAKAVCKKLGVDYKAVSIEDCLAGKTKTDVYSGFFYDLNYAEQWNFSLSAPIRDINYYIIQKKESQIDFNSCKIAAMKEFRYTSEYLQNYYKNAEFIYYPSYEECIRAVADGAADMAVINNYIAEYYLNMYQFSDLSAKLSTEYSHLFCFATSDKNDILASVITKAISMISDDEMNQIYIVGQEKHPESNFFEAMLYQNPMLVSLVIGGVLALLVIIIMLVLFAAKSKKQNRELAAALSAKSNFLARMSHDMRTPMNGILGLSYIMEDQSDAESVKSYIPQIRESGNYLLRLINDVLDVNKIESGKLELNAKACDEEKLFSSVIDMVKPMIEAKKIDFRFERINIEWQYMMLDEQRVKQIFINLLSNAVKFTPEGGKIEFTMELVNRTDKMIRDKFIIRDNGIGMSEEFQKHLFEPFKQEERSESINNDGTGLGLSIVKQLVELMGGSISVKSAINKGTEICIYINFPLAEKPDPEKAENPAVIPAGLNILVCEDHPLNAKIITKMLEKFEANVTVAENGEIGLKAFSDSAEGYFDFILMDIRMPVMDGLEAAKAIRALKREDAKTVPMAAVTANAYDEDIEKALEAGMNAHLAKPIDPPALYRLISTQLKK